MARYGTPKLTQYRKAFEYRTGTSISGGYPLVIARTEERRQTEVVTYEQDYDAVTTSHAASPGADGFSGFTETEQDSTRSFQSPRDGKRHHTERWEKKGEYAEVS